jgi:hypothetical protein
MLRAASSILALAVVLAATSACSRKKPEIDGLGNWRFGKTTRQDAGSCQPENGVVWCFELPIQAGGLTFEPNLYFASNEPDAPLVEILVSVPGCREPELIKWLDEGLGDPTEKREGRRYYVGKKIFVAAQVPAEPSRCELSFVPPTDSDRIAKLKAK